MQMKIAKEGLPTRCLFPFFFFVHTLTSKSAAGRQPNEIDEPKLARVA